MKFYTSDLHFDHSNMLDYEKRPWDTVEKMNEVINSERYAQIKA